MSLNLYSCKDCGKRVIGGLFHAPTNQCIPCLRNSIRAADEAKTKMAEDLVR